MTQKNNIGAGIALMVGATIVFALQDGISRHLAGTYNTYMVVMVRYWFFAAFVIALAARSPGGLRAATQTNQLGLQITRGVLLAAEICVAVFGFTILGLIDSMAVFICYPLLVAALSGPVLGEQVGWRRWSAIGVGCIGVLIILQPGAGVFNPWAIIPLISALMFAVYALLTRYAARQDSTATSFFWTGVAGSVAMTLVGIWFWEPMVPADWGWMALLCVSGASGHWLLIKCYEMAEASAVQPFAYFHLVWSAMLGISVFGETLRPEVVAGAAIVVAAGLFTLWRERRQR
ncbi:MULTISPECIES: DMT family transporter [unclassified Ruegeria]|uniref:DMT family transporter n=1 Tax=unclassified Ruegeria TaxID=2625375 RepID=UPI0014890CC9|nr:MULTISPECIES: DMT family transporter [unclassified Ruegeria]NOD65203.1 EamA family transporter [Ruegeria sp. HKCCD6109]NOD78431.1 EamA family transporter [Ruegeria sp. HKCCD4332]NOD90429.1 EamA family transporter [Ruegeria sp. HKCCD4318]NOD94187.1 EamA family transporter [Ruegeria sp. HKCCD4884]NOE15501.1 EamA family transporter [Ruegeria sp. HKCCD4318-2]